jgi:hypothetical protein
MTKTIYVDWEERVVMTEEEYTDLLEEEKEFLMNDENRFDDWLTDRFSSIELWKMTVTLKARALKEFQESCEKLAEQELSYNNIEKFEIEI